MSLSDLLVEILPAGQVQSFWLQVFWDTDLFTPVLQISISDFKISNFEKQICNPDVNVTQAVHTECVIIAQRRTL